MLSSICCCSHTFFSLSFYESIHIQQFEALQNHHCAFQESHNYGKSMQKSVVFPVQELPALCENCTKSFHPGQENKIFYKKKWNAFTFLPFENVFRSILLTSRMVAVIECQIEKVLQWLLPWRIWRLRCLLAHDEWVGVIEDVSLIHHDWFNRARRAGQFHSSKKIKNSICCHICAGLMPRGQITPLHFQSAALSSAD